MKHIKAALVRATREAAVYGCVIEPEGWDGRTHYRFRITNLKTGAFTRHSVGSSPKSADGMVDSIGNAVRRKARALVGLGPTG